MGPAPSTIMLRGSVSDSTALSGRLREAEDLMRELALGDVRSRLLFLLLKLCGSFGERDGEWVRVQVDLTHQDLANMIGATRESVSSTLATYPQLGWSPGDFRAQI